MAETVASMADPEAAKAGSRAVTITAATFLVSRSMSRTLTPSRSSMALRLCLVNGALRRVSPVWFSPTTMP